MEFMTAQEAGQKWKLSSRMIAYYCASGRIPGVEKKGNVWFLPLDAEKPKDKRYRKDVYKRQPSDGGGAHGHCHRRGARQPGFLL